MSDLSNWVLRQSRIEKNVKINLTIPPQYKTSPANKNIIYTLETAFDIIVTHEQRHLAQAKEVLEMLKNKNSNNNAHTHQSKAPDA